MIVSSVVMVTLGRSFDEEGGSSKVKVKLVLVVTIREYIFCIAEVDLTNVSSAFKFI